MTEGLEEELVALVVAAVDVGEDGGEMVGEPEEDVDVDEQQRGS